MRKDFNKKRVLVTGGLGFIGSNLARTLVELGSKVTLVDSMIPEYGGNLFNIADIQDQVWVNITDVRDGHSMKYLVVDQDYLFNLAGQTSHMDSMQDPFTDLEINSRAQLSILEACRRYNPEVKLVFASTRQVYGRPIYLPVDEKHPLQPVDVNGINKMAGEFYHLLYNNVYNLKSSVLRLTNTYGPGMRIKDSRQTFLGIWIKLLVEGKPFEVWDGDQLRDFTFVDDAVRALLLAAVHDHANGCVFNLGGDSTVTLKQLAELIVEIDGHGTYAVRPYPADRKPIDIGSYYSDYSLIRNKVGWEPRISLRDGLSRTIEFYRDNLDKYV
jgi:UDP-glucose 4-epimerase